MVEGLEFSNGQGRSWGPGLLGTWLLTGALGILLDLGEQGYSSWMGTPWRGCSGSIDCHWEHGGLA